MRDIVAICMYGILVAGFVIGTQANSILSGNANAAIFSVFVYFLATMLGVAALLSIKENK